jgi:hypothetical protein
MNHGRYATTKRARTGKTNGASWTLIATSSLASKFPTAADSHFHLSDRASERYITSCFQQRTLHEAAFNGVTILRNFGLDLDRIFEPVQTTHMHGLALWLFYEQPLRHFSCILFGNWERILGCVYDIGRYIDENSDHRRHVSSRHYKHYTGILLAMAL